MSNGDDETSPDADTADSAATDASDTDDGSDDAGAELATTESLRDRLDAASEALENAETEADLDDVEALLDAIEADLAESDVPHADDGDDDADETETREALESELGELRAALAEARGPYGEDVVSAIETAQATIAEGDWTEQGEHEVVDAVLAFAEAMGDIDADKLSLPAAEIDAFADTDNALAAIAESVSAADFDADADAETLDALIEATDALETDLQAAQEWADLTVRETLQAAGYYDVLGHTKDYPPEWAALKEHEQRGNTEMVLLALDSLDSDFMEEHCLDALVRMGPVAATDEAIEEMLARAQKRKRVPITILGKMGATEAVETLIEYVDADKDPALQKVTFRALGEIGDERAVQPLANKLLMENDVVRPQAARALGLIGDTRAINPLADTLKADENENVRAQAAWALRQIGTKRALEAVVDHGSDETFIVQTEIDKARTALDAGVQTA